MGLDIDDDKIVILIAATKPRRPWWWWIKRKPNISATDTVKQRRSIFEDYEPVKDHSVGDAFITDRRPRIVRK